MLIYILFVLILISAFNDLKKTILIYAPLKLFFNSNVLLINFPRLSFDASVCITFFLIWLLTAKKYKNENFPLKWPFLIYGLAYGFSCFYPQYAFSQLPDVVFGILIYSFLFYKVIRSHEDIKLVVHAYILFAFILCGNGLLQYFANINPLDDLIKSWTAKGSGFFSDNDLSRMGLQGRVRSFIPHAITYGVACLSILFMIGYYVIVNRRFIKPYYLTIISSLLLFSGVFLCGSRTPILGFIPFVFLYKYFFQYIRKSFFLFILLFIITYYVFYDYISYTFLSIFDENIASEAGGSNLDMRIGQLTLSWWMFLKAPYFGNGAFYDMLEEGGVEMFGAESVWFPIMAKKGLLGLISYIILYIGSINMVNRLHYRMLSFVFIISWLIMRTATSFVGLDDSMLFIFLILFYKYEMIGKQSNFSIKRSLQ